jgi:hypothetical protein
MNTLTPNRILQKGDEYRDNGTWKAIPKDDYGLQIQFTTYKEVRRPTETPFVHGGAPAIKHDEATKPNPVPDKVTPVPTAPLAQSEKEIVDAGLPTFVSRKAHSVGKGSGKPIGFDHKGKLVREKPETSKDATTEVAESPASPVPACTYDHEGKAPFPPLPPAPVGLSAPTTYQEITFPVGSPHTIWTGRNGTFNSVAVNLHRYKGTDVCAIIPQGKRGVAKNAIIEFPITAIPQMIDFLKRQLL